MLAGTFMVVLDFFIVNVALPSMQHDLHASGGAIEWVVAGYALTSAVFLITAARLGDHIGRRRMFSIGLGLFTLASAACGMAGTPAVLVAARLMQGIGAALLMPNVLIDHRRHVLRLGSRPALGAYGLVMGVAAVCGSVVACSSAHSRSWMPQRFDLAARGSIAPSAPRLVPDRAPSIAADSTWPERCSSPPV